MAKQNSHQNGFTIIELMIATAVFSMILLICMTAIIQIGRFYFKGITSARTQEKVRTLSDDIGGAIKFSRATITTGSLTMPNGSIAKSICIAPTNVRYTYVLNAQLEKTPTAANQLRHVLWRDTYSGPTCTPLDLYSNAPPTGSSADGKEMMGEHMTLVDFQLTNGAGSPPALWQLYVASVYGDSDLYTTASDGTYTTPTCKSGAGTQFCAASVLKTSIYGRIE